jgi:predicted dehydrogenase
VVGVLQVNWLTPTKLRELSVLGEGGLLQCNYLSQELTHFRNAEATGLDDAQQLAGVSEGEVVRHPIAKDEPLKLELQSFLRAVRGQGAIEVDGEDGLRALHLAQSLVVSAREGRLLDHAEIEALWVGARPLD